MKRTSLEENSTEPRGRDSPLPDRNTLLEEYNKYLPARSHIVRKLENRIIKAVSLLPSHPRVQGRIKTFESFFKKRIRLLKNDISQGSMTGRRAGDARPQSTITDIIGIRIICPFLEDLAKVEELLKKNFQVVEVERKGGDHTYREFGYESIHLLITIPDDLTDAQGMSPDETAEIQIRTILQDAWAEVEHELVYKAEFTPFDGPLKRKLAAVNATLSLADIIFQEIRSYQRELNGELGKRRDSFFKKIEESTDDVLFTAGKAAAEGAASAARHSHDGDSSPIKPGAVVSSNVSIDDLLLNALYAHNKNLFDDAISIYTQILEMRPENAISALIYKHRGMAHFARSHYEEAIADFEAAIKLDPKAYKAAYYQGIICSVLGRYSKAVEAFNHSLEINPYQPYCLYRRGQAYYHLEDYPQALGDCEAALALESFDAVLKFKDLVLDKLKM